MRYSARLSNVSACFMLSKCLLLRSKCFLLRRKCFLLNLKCFLLSINASCELQLSFNIFFPAIFVQVFSRDGSFLREYRIPDLKASTLAVGEGDQIVIADSANRCVHVVNMETGISNSLIIHEENTKEIITEMEFGYVMKHLHKIKPTFISIFPLNILICLRCYIKHSSSFLIYYFSNSSIFWE